jgi:hypothetical protein
MRIGLMLMYERVERYGPSSVEAGSTHYRNNSLNDLPLICALSVKLR